MSSLPQTADRRQITGPPFITCVDLDGHQTPRTELWDGPSEGIDPTHPASWPGWTDNFFWEPGSGQDDELTAAERADFESWLASVDDGPPLAQVSPEELAAIAAGMAIG